MRIKILFFAQLREAFGVGERTLEVQEGVTVGEVTHSLLRGSRSPELTAMPLLYAVNEDLVEGTRGLSDEDVLALLPPVAGG